MRRRSKYLVSARMEGDVKEVIVVLLALDADDARRRFKDMMNKLGLTYFHANAEKYASSF